jgi:hypothetical protein
MGSSSSRIIHSHVSQSLDRSPLTLEKYPTSPFFLVCRVLRCHPCGACFRPGFDSPLRSHYKAVSESLDLGEWFAQALSPHTERLLPALARPPARPSLALSPTVAPKAEPTPPRTVVDLPVSGRVTGIYDIALALGPIINLGAKSIPSNNTGQQFCLNYHVKGSCHSACIRRVDHRTHSAAESNTLHTFLAERSATVAAAGPL